MAAVVVRFAALEARVEAAIVARIVNSAVDDVAAVMARTVGPALDAVAAATGPGLEDIAVANIAAAAAAARIVVAAAATSGLASVATVHRAAEAKQTVATLAGVSVTVGMVLVMGRTVV